MEGAGSRKTEVQDQRHDQDRRAEDGQQGYGNDRNDELWNIPGLFAADTIEFVQVLIAYCYTKMLLVPFSDRLFDLTRRGRSR